MASNVVIPTTGYYADPAKGVPLSGAQIYIGLPDLDPEIEANRVAIELIDETGATIPIAPNQQPINTGAGGVPLYQGSTVQISSTVTDYSLKVLDSLGSQKYYIPNSLLNATFLEASNNLSDVDDLAQARTNLDVYSKSEALGSANNLSDVADVDEARLNLKIGSTIGYIYGLEISIDSGDPDHDILLGAGTARDATDSLDINSVGNLIKAIDSNWVEGGGGGFPSGLTLSSNTNYYIIVLSKVNGVDDMGFDVSTDATNLLADAGSSGYVNYAVIGAIQTDANSNLRFYYNINDIGRDRLSFDLAVGNHTIPDPFFVSYFQDMRLQGGGGGGGGTGASGSGGGGASTEITGIVSASGGSGGRDFASGSTGGSGGSVSVTDSAIYKNITYRNNGSTGQLGNSGGAGGASGVGSSGASAGNDGEYGSGGGRDTDISAGAGGGGGGGAFLCLRNYKLTGTMSMVVGGSGSGGGGSAGNGGNGFVVVTF